MSDKPIIFNDAMVRAILDGRKTQTRRIVKSIDHDLLDMMAGDAEEEIDSDLLGLKYGPSLDDDQNVVPEQWLAFCTECEEEGVMTLGQGYGKPGDLLWVREAWRIGAWRTGLVDDAIRGDCPVWRPDDRVAIDYAADSHCRQEWLHVPDREMHDRLVTQSLKDARRAGYQGEDISWEPGDSPCRWRPSIHMPRWASRITLEITDVRVERLQDVSEDDAWNEGVQEFMGSETPLKGELAPVSVHAFAALWESINGTGSWDADPWVWCLEFSVIHKNIDEVLLNDS